MLILPNWRNSIVCVVRSPWLQLINKWVGIAFVLLAKKAIAFGIFLVRSFFCATQIKSDRLTLIKRGAIALLV
ncbi:MAG: hypothetical protein RMY36_001695 [Nostoc sp. SerVER01]|nr:hypothetical protein [Nostoc sp. SerVER01]MDZ8074066.1 hypothetical protein [Nostoc sp. DedQUE01]MDZ8077539.1 hypothetical protein [Nostoc sp. DcaGUA01]